MQQRASVSSRPQLSAWTGAPSLVPRACTARCGTLGGAAAVARGQRCRTAAAGGGGADDAPSTSYNHLSATIKRKQRQVESQLTELGMEALDERLQSATQAPVNPPYRLSRLISQITSTEGRAALVVEIARPSPSATPTQLAALAKRAVAAGADALVVRIDTEDTPEGSKDLWAVTQAVRVPVLARDWCIHPLQVVEAKEAGAAGLVGVIAQVNGRGTAVMSSFSAALGLDAPVEIVNSRELEGLSRMGVVFYGVNIGVGISVSLPGFASDLAHGLLGEMPFGAISLVGAKGLEDARKARLSGADAVLVKKEMWEAAEAEGRGLEALLEQVRYVTGGDD
ncbi:indole-3-glycerol-phosphate synthase [Raphidocelis subcapitata]|uniref:indole-3-glycerol-phosphate synthase n=1 Tax=Raphidocelis subcapitata TaxID=307507 RepID=A0A2V0PMU4_9CHLO|nr:indole-3-glycerol-phosphate synthase [Raphidocelis subcapitata]|eukprot:GBF99220.1 indole-3-glycerol-phosphate synthase [Raphidocelis subcapitata]